MRRRSLLTLQPVEQGEIDRCRSTPLQYVHMCDSVCVCVCVYACMCSAVVLGIRVPLAL